MKCIFVQARYYLKKGTRSEFYRRFRDNNISEMSQSEEGNIDYELYLPLDSDDDICIMEKWKDIDSLKKHSETLHYAIFSEIKAKYATKVEIKKAWLEEV